MVGDTRDACGGTSVQFATKTGSLSVLKGQNQNLNKGNPAPVALPSMTREITWYCDGTRERSANDTPFNAVEIQRAPNGAIHWTFFVISEAASNATLIRVGDTKDACDGRQPVKLKALPPGASPSAPLETIEVSAGQIRMAQLPALSREIGWTCGTSQERSANSLPFNQFQLERAGNGALQWVFYRSMAITNGVGLGKFIHNVPGDLFLPAKFAQLNAGTLKNGVSQFWTKNSDTISKLVQAVVPAKVTLAPVSQLELRVMQSPDTVTLKVVAHGNQATPLANDHVTATLDLEAVLPFPRSQTLTITKQHTVTGLVLNKPEAVVGHTEVEGNDPGGAIAVAFGKARVRAKETATNSTPPQALDATAIIAAIESQLGPIAQSLPPGTAPISLDVDASGDVRVCPAAFKPCQFPAPSALPPAPRVLATSADQCSQGTIWLWDAELGQFVSFTHDAQATHGAKVVQVDDKRFEWYCGDDSGPDPSPSNEESASGPIGTYQVRGFRDPEGRSIHWEFLFWR
jgi:hypothetical protein